MSGVRSYVSGLSLILLLGSGSLGGLLYVQWHENVALQYQGASLSGQSSTPAEDPVTIAAFSPVPLRSLGEITERPLFTEGRTPPKEPVDSPPSAVAAVPLRLRLEGVAITPENKVAIITDLQTNELLRLSQGMSHSNWRVARVSEESVVIQQGTREITLDLELDEAASAAGKPRVPFKLPVRPPARR